MPSSFFSVLLSGSTSGLALTWFSPATLLCSSELLMATFSSSFFSVLLSSSTPDFALTFFSPAPALRCSSELFIAPFPSSFFSALLGPLSTAACLFSIVCLSCLNFSSSDFFPALSKAGRRCPLEGRVSLEKSLFSLLSGFCLRTCLPSALYSLVPFCRLGALFVQGSTTESVFTVSVKVPRSGSLSGKVSSWRTYQSTEKININSCMWYSRIFDNKHLTLFRYCDFI